MARLIPLGKKALGARIQKSLDSLIDRLQLGDWKIYWHIDLSPGGEACAEFKQRANYKEGTITIYPKVIRELQQEGYEETLEDVILHEMLHVLVCDCFLNVDDDILEHSQFDKAEEILVEKLVRILR